MGDPALWLAVIVVVIGGFFAACHIALKEFTRSKLAELLEARRRGDQLAWVIERRYQLLLMTAFLRMCANLTVLLATLYYVEHNFFLVEHGWADSNVVVQYLIAFAVAGVMLSVFVIAIPEALARYCPEKMLAHAMPALLVFDTLFTPIALVLHAFDPLVKRLSGYRENEDTHAQISSEVLSVVEDHESGDTVDEGQKDMIEAVFEFKSTTVDQIMTPRTDIVGIEVGADLATIKKTIIDSGFSRLPVYAENIDEIIGMLYAKDMIALIESDAQTLAAFEIRKLCREALLVPETKRVSELLEEFRERKVHIAIVLDEYGGTAGLVTAEDIIEEIIGEIWDEYEQEEASTPIDRIDELTTEVDARTYVDDINDELDITLPEDDDYDTIGGLVLSRLGHVPQVGEVFEVENVRITVTAAERTRVTRVRIERLNGDADPAVRTRNGQVA